MKLIDEFEIISIGGDNVAVSVGDTEKCFNGFIRLNNDSAVFIFKNLSEEISRDELKKRCMEEYDESSEEEITECIEQFLSALKEKNLIVD